VEVGWYRHIDHSVSKLRLGWYDVDRLVLSRIIEGSGGDGYGAGVQGV
jgi:hypothetical protein